MGDSKQGIAQYGLIGETLKHSFSKNYFNNKFEKESIVATYENFELEEIDLFPSIFKSHKNIKGLNVTIPYKESIIPFLDTVTIAAKLVGAVNTVKVNEEGKTSGHNTDVIGFQQSIEPLLNENHCKALVLGTGGASKAVQFVLNKFDIEVQLVSRYTNSRQIAYEEVSADLLHQHKLIVNTTPLGMFPYEDDMPDLPYEGISEQHLLFDLIYNPKESMFLSVGKDLGAQIKNGYEMLELQAEASWAIWNGE